MKKYCILILKIIFTYMCLKGVGRASAIQVDDMIGSALRKFSLFEITCTITIMYVIYDALIGYGCRGTLAEFKQTLKWATIFIALSFLLKLCVEIFFTDGRTLPAAAALIN